MRSNSELRVAMSETAEHSSSYLLKLVDLAKPKLKQRLPQTPPKDLAVLPGAALVVSGPALEIT